MGETLTYKILGNHLVEGKLIAPDPDQPTYIDLKPVREQEK